jgi:Uma2 family endonuclease
VITVEEYRALPEKPGCYVELHHGELVEVPIPKFGHWRLMNDLVDLLKPLAGELGLVGYQFPFRAVPEYDLRAARVAFLSRARWKACDPDDNLHGAPEIVVELVSEQYKAMDLNEKEELCLQNGCLEFWAIYQMRRTVTITNREFVSVRYSEGDQIPLALFGNATLSVDAIFETSE